MNKQRKNWVAITLTLLIMTLVGCRTTVEEEDGNCAIIETSPEAMVQLAQMAYAIQEINLRSDYVTSVEKYEKERRKRDKAHPVKTEPPHVAANSPFDLSKVKWLHTNVSGWKQTASLDVKVSGSKIVLNYSKAKVWKGKQAVGVNVNANPWIFVQRNGTWYAATWEWLRPGQTTKSRGAVAGDHIKRAPLQNFKPRAGETYGFMVSGLARDGTRNVKERSEIVMLQWPGNSQKKIMAKKVSLLGTSTS